MRKKKWYEHEYDTVAYSGRCVPYNMIIIGLIVLFFTPISTDNLIINEGVVINYNESSHRITIINDSVKTVYIVGFVKNRTQLKSLMPTVKHVKIWTKKRYPKNVKQMEADGQIVIPYNWWVETWFFWGFIVVGVILIPFTERSYRKWRRGEKKKDMEYYIQQAKFRSRKRK